MIRETPLPADIGDLAMTLDALLPSFVGPTGMVGLYLASFAVCILSGLLPLVSAEAYLLAVSVLAPPEHAIPLTLTAATGQMVAKSLLFHGGAGVLRLPGRSRWADRADQAHARLVAWPGGTGVALFCSASLGFPPLYLTSIAAGALRVRFGTFFVLGLAGRFLRFASVYSLPLVLRSFYS